MFKNITALVPSKKKVVFLYAFLSFFIIFTVFTLGLYLSLLNDLDNRTNVAKNALSDRMNAIFTELKQVVNDSSLSCEKADITRLRRATFYSPIFKEFGLFNSEFIVYCSNLGTTNIKIYDSIASRITQSMGRKTVSLVNSNTLGESTFFAFYQRDDGLGVNGLAPPDKIAASVDQILLPDYFYELTLGKQILFSNSNDIDSRVLGNTEVSLADWSMTLAVFFPSSLYWRHLWSLLPFIIVCWVLLSFVFYVGHLVLVYYRRSLRHCIKRAIKNNTMEVHFQPIVSLTEGGFHEMEALIRWNSFRYGQVSPLVIVDMADRLGLIDHLTWMVIRKVGDFYREYPEQLRHIKISVNVDRHSLLKEGFASDLAEILEEYPELKGRLGLEVTETSVLDAAELPLMVSRFEHIKALGVSLSVDDFGTGYAGLDFLRRFPYDTLKLDQIFIASLKDDQFTRQILTSVTKLAKELNMELIAEGVEHEDQLNAVRELGVDRVQGYYFCRPLPKEQVIAWFEENASP
ncbi:EAL domain, c-di-GMP-specific phosphodiesterase class I (or its enzymatically inactive variant) [Marinomonas polaris DSM 16579]|uniref:cyclic-guanylate-specific phosphodiesterase n=1 Tax=Marinomonas polaris DSM 16579 TaxID=1122206 RepID=A0A1M5H8B2_9GAMM|nr:EAL domain-containing protein [Marinomonas polaris]SHG12128.1 EAL domain, c-di-GMP-specific phosphodiesterase class I (or its enzymatically inactive variant) [Marinomonas polaris DSM 16579]